MDKAERIKMVKAMEFIARQVNNEDIFNAWWLLCGVADGDIEYGDLEVHPDELKEDSELDIYIEDDEEFRDLMDTFLRMMKYASKSGGLYCDGVCGGGK